MTENEVKIKVFKILQKDTLNRASIGYTYLYRVLLECLRIGNEYKGNICKILTGIASDYGTTFVNVERQIRYSLQTSKLGKVLSEVVQTVMIMVENDIEL